MNFVRPRGSVCMIKSVVTHTRGWVGQKVVISSLCTFWIISRWNFTIQTMTYLNKLQKQAKLNVTETSYRNKCYRNVTETSQIKQSVQSDHLYHRIDFLFDLSKAVPIIPIRRNDRFDLYWSDVFLLSDIISNFILLLKAHRQVSKKRSLKSIIYVINHANFQLYRAHPDVVDRSIYDKFTNKQ